MVFVADDDCRCAVEYGGVVQIVVGVAGKCRYDSYAINALRCDVWVVCAHIPVCIVTCFICF